MLHTILEALTKQLSTRLVDWSIDPVKTSIIVSLGKETVINSLRTHVAVFSRQNLIELFRKPEPLEKSQLVRRMISDYKSDLVNLGDLKEKQADVVSKFVVPFLLLLISHKTNTNPSSLEALLVENEDRGLFSKVRFWSSISPR